MRDWKPPLCPKCQKPIARPTEAVIANAFPRVNYFHARCAGQTMLEGALPVMRGGTALRLVEVKRALESGVRVRQVVQSAHVDMVWPAMTLWALGLDLIAIFGILNWGRMGLNWWQALLFVLLALAGLQLSAQSILLRLAVSSHERLCAQYGETP